MAAVLSDCLHRQLALRWEYWNHVDSVSDWTVLSLSAFLFLSEPEFRTRLLSATPEREIDGRGGRIVKGSKNIFLC